MESFNARLRDELLNGEIFYTLREAQIVIESWRRHYNAVRPHASFDYRPPAPEVFVPALAAWPSAPPRPPPTATLPLMPDRSLRVAVGRGTGGDHAGLAGHAARGHRLADAQKNVAPEFSRKKIAFADLVNLAKLRWRIEHDYHSFKQEDAVRQGTSEA